MRHPIPEHTTRIEHPTSEYKSKCEEILSQRVPKSFRNDHSNSFLNPIQL